MSEFTKRLGLDKLSLSELVENAHKEVSKLCHGGRWNMCIPVQAGDSDIIITEALLAQTREIERLNAELEKANSEIERILRETDPEILLSRVWELVGKPETTKIMIAGKEYTYYDAPLTTLEKSMKELEAFRTRAKQENNK